MSLPMPPRSYAADVHGRHHIAIRRDEEQVIECYLVALRLATIEAAVWDATGNQQYAGSDFEKLKQMQPAM